MTIPVTVIGGFLGSGKTTLVNRILAASPARTAVLVNDFGEINVDFALVKSGDDLTFELSGGCICCSMAEGVGPAIKNALKTNPQTILIEASGVGEPRRIAEFALIDPALRLDMIVTLANAAALAKQINDPLIGDTVARQFDGADLIVMNHADAATPEALKTSYDILRRLAPGRRVIETVEANLPLDLLTATTHAIFGAGPVDEETDHDSIYSRDQYESDVPLNLRVLEHFLTSLPASVLRLKGWVLIEGEADPCLLQFVAGRWSVTPAPDAPRKTRLVSIASQSGFRIADTINASACQAN